MPPFNLDQSTACEESGRFLLVELLFLLWQGYTQFLQSSKNIYEGKYQLKLLWGD
jgi:hypothetical protein